MSISTCSVSVVVPVFNSAATLQRAVHSALQQDVADLELLIVDDGSTDTTGQVASALAADPRVRVITLPSNHGKPHAMNTAVAVARGEWIAVLDADDWYAPNRLTTLLGQATRHSVDLVADNQFIYDDGAGQIVRTAFACDEDYCRLDKTSFIAGCDPYADFDYGMLKPVVRTGFIRNACIAYRENARLSEDFLYLLEFFAAGGKGLLLSEPLYYWRQAFGSVSRQWTGTAAGSWRYDFLSGVRANADVLTAMHEKGETLLAALLVQRMQAFHRLHHLQEINRLRANGAASIQLAARILRCPSIWPLVAQRSLRRLLSVRGHHSPNRA